MSPESLAEVLHRVSESNPSWLIYPLSHLRESLCVLSCDELRVASSQVSTHNTVQKHYDKMSCVNVILEHFDYHQTSFLSCSLAFLRASLQKINETVPPKMTRFEMISMFFESTYGSLVASALRKSPWPALDSFSISEESCMENMPWLTSDLTPWMNRLPRKILIGRLKSCLQSMHPSTRPMFKPSSKQ